MKSIIANHVNESRAVDNVLRLTLADNSGLHSVVEHLPRRTSEAAM
jgi:hypothetical protein